jgi:CMP-2-keto-3-deoxyoctulosonic acid synthetase
MVMLYTSHVQKSLMREIMNIATFYKHIGIYAYKRESLLKMHSLEQPDIEKAESLEQLRALYYGMKLKLQRLNTMQSGSIRWKICICLKSLWKHNFNFLKD